MAVQQVQGVNLETNYVKPNYSTGDKVAAAFGDETGKINKENFANYENALNFIMDQVAYKKAGYLKNGINPLIAASQGAFNNFTSSPQVQSSKAAIKNNAWKDLRDLLSAPTKIGLELLKVLFGALK